MSKFYDLLSKVWANDCRAEETMAFICSTLSDPFSGMPYTRTNMVVISPWLTSTSDASERIQRPYAILDSFENFFGARRSFTPPQGQ